MASKLFLCFVVTVLTTLSVDKTESRYRTGYFSTFLSNILTQKLAALNPLNMPVAGNQSTLRPSLVTIIFSPNQSQTPMVATAGSGNAARPGNAGAAPSVVESAIKPTAINPPTPSDTQPQSTPGAGSAIDPTASSVPPPLSDRNETSTSKASVGNSPTEDVPVQNLPETTAESTAVSEPSAEP